jgi:hypothetical protein
MRKRLAAVQSKTVRSIFVHNDYAAPMERSRTSLPDHLKVTGADGRNIEVVMGSEALVLKRGMFRFDLTPHASLTQLRWMLWHALHGRWAPKPEPVAYPRPNNHDHTNPEG